MALLCSCDQWYSYCIIISNSCFYILLNSWENPFQLSLLFAMPFRRASTLQHHAIFVFQNNMTVTILSMVSLLAKICSKNKCYEATLVSIFPMNFLSWETNLFPALPAFRGMGLLRREIGSIISVMFKRSIERNKVGKGIDLKLYNVTFNIWIKTLWKSW